jgi:hypothetical protein
MIRVAFAAVVVVVALGCQKHSQGHPVIDDFRKVEHATLQTFNGLLAQQRANAIDELGLADAIDKEVLPPWRDMRARVDAAEVPADDRELYATLRRYVAERQTAWEAYSAALRSPNDAASKPHYATYHEQNAAADADARTLGEAFRRPGF